MEVERCHIHLVLLSYPLPFVILCHVSAETNSDDRVFRVYLGNIPHDVIIEDISINGKQLIISESAERGYSISPIVHANGSQAFELQLPFEDSIVHWMVRDSPFLICSGCGYFTVLHDNFNLVSDLSLGKTT